MCRNLKLSAFLIIIFALSSVSALKFTFSLKAGAKTCYSELLSNCIFMKLNRLLSISVLRHKTISMKLLSTTVMALL